MINVTKLLLNTENDGDHLRYNANPNIKAHGVSEGHGPIVVWNATKACNLSCLHCYADADYNTGVDELSTEEAEEFINDLAYFKVPVLLFSGGEPLMRKDIFHLIAFASEQGIRPVISTNGTLITEEIANKLKDAGVKYVGISVDGIGESNDKFRCKSGAYEKAISGIKNCINIEQKVGLRFTINKHNYDSLEGVFDLIDKEGIPRVCFYHLVYSGRGSSLINADVSREEARQALELIINKTLDFHRRGKNVEILTVDNHADGVFIYNWMREQNPNEAERVLKLLKRNRGNRSGIALACVDWSGNVYLDQFTRDISLGSIRERKFSQIWTDTSHPVLAGMRDRKPLLNGRCKKCRWLDICNGNFRARASAMGDFWGSDPACYLTDDEIGSLDDKGV